MERGGMFGGGGANRVPVGGRGQPGQQWGGQRNRRWEAGHFLLLTDLNCRAII